MRIQHDMEELPAIGMSPLEAITAATWMGAQLPTVSERTGRIGLVSSRYSIVHARDSFSGFRAVHEPLIVVNIGKVVLNRYFPNPYDDERRTR